MAETIPGGAYRRGDQWIDAEGRPLTKEQAAKAEALAAERQAERDAAEARARALDAQRDPTGRAIAQALGPLLTKPARAEK